MVLAIGACNAKLLGRNSEYITTGQNLYYLNHSAIKKQSKRFC